MTFNRPTHPFTRSANHNHMRQAENQSPYPSGWRGIWMRFVDRFIVESASTYNFMLSILFYVHQRRMLLLAGRYHAAFYRRPPPYRPFYRRPVNNPFPQSIVEKLETMTFAFISYRQERFMVSRLSKLPEPTLLFLLSVNHAALPYISEALGWGRDLPVVQSMRVVRFNSLIYDSKGDHSASYEFVPRLLDIDSIRHAIAESGQSETRAVCKSFKTADKISIQAAMLIEAIAGLNQSEVIERFDQNDRTAIRAFGLLPISNGHPEVLDRYMAIHQIRKDGYRLGYTRRFLHARAVEDALEYLARNAGYENARQLMWKMESKIGNELAPAGRQWTVEPYTLTLELDQTDVKLAVNRGDRRLKSNPKAVRASDVYPEAKDATKHLRHQVTRLRTDVFEDLIASGDCLTLDELRHLVQIPVANDLCGRLIWRLPGGVTGLLDTENLTLTDLDGLVHPIDAAVGLAHAYHLFVNDTLSAWQREIVRRRIVQPIKQAFRELYVLTPAEHETAAFSNRFARHSVNGKITATLLASRNWQISKSRQQAIDFKVFGEIRAVFNFAFATRDLGRNQPITTDQVYFEPFPAPRGHRHGSTRKPIPRLPLEDIPPLVFSEVMRDCDLVVAVAQQDGEIQLSNESYAQRATLIKTLLSDLDLTGVDVSGHFAYVTGKRANYRVHLGSAVIHIEPGNYLCIVPARWGLKHEKLFLPFVDENDSKTSEVISKILFLLADDKITDGSILRQIKHAQSA